MKTLIFNTPNGQYQKEVIRETQYYYEYFKTKSILNYSYHMRIGTICGRVNGESLEILQKIRKGREGDFQKINTIKPSRIETRGKYIYYFVKKYVHKDQIGDFVEVVEIKSGVTENNCPF